LPPAPLFFPPPPRSFRGRNRDLATLAATVRAHHPTRVALVGAGGSGKSTLASALGHRTRRFFRGGLAWFRVGAWDPGTLLEMLALRFGLEARGKALIPALRRHLSSLPGPSLVVLDNHEDDRSTAALLDTLRDEPVTWVITARRCLLAGVTVFPVAPPLVTLGQSPFPRIASLTRLLRWNPVALDLADALVADGIIDESSLGQWLRARGVDRVHAVAHEDDLPEVSLLVAFAWSHLPPAAHRMLTVLAHMGGDHIDVDSLETLAKARGRKAEALARLVRLRLVQEPMAGRFTLHATVRHALEKRTAVDPGLFFEHYLALLEHDPSRLDLEQTHLFAAMDHAQASGDLETILRVQGLASALGAGAES